MSLTESERRHLVDLLAERPARDTGELILALVEAPAGTDRKALVNGLLRVGGLDDVDQRHAEDIADLLVRL